MHILYLHQYFATPAGTTGTRSYEFARRWVRAGHEVTVITGYFDKSGLAKQQKLIYYQKIGKINVVIINAFYSNYLSFWKRVASFIAYMIISTYLLIKMKKPEIVYATSTPLTIGIPAIFCKIIKHIPFIFEVRDEWPRIPDEMGILKNKILIAFLYWLEKSIYHYASGIVALSPGMKRNILKYTNTDTPIIVAPNSADLTLFNPAINPQALHFRQKLDLEGKFVLIHFGTISHANGLNFIIDVSKNFKEYPDIHFLIIGDGSERKDLMNRIRNENISNVKIILPVSKMNLPYYVALADVALVLFNNYPILENNSANKFFDSLSAGKPILLNYSGWQREIIEKYQAGLGTNLWDMDQFEINIHRLYNDPVLCEKMGINARMLAEKEFDRDKISLNILQFIIKIAG